MRMHPRRSPRSTARVSGSLGALPSRGIASTPTRVPVAFGRAVPSTVTVSTCGPGPRPSSRWTARAPGRRPHPSIVSTGAPSIESRARPNAGPPIVYSVTAPPVNARAAVAPFRCSHRYESPRASAVPTCPPREAGPRAVLLELLRRVETGGHAPRPVHGHGAGGDRAGAGATPGHEARGRVGRSRERHVPPGRERGRARRSRAIEAGGSRHDAAEAGPRERRRRPGTRTPPPRSERRTRSRRTSGTFPPTRRRPSSRATSHRGPGWR